VRGYFPWVLGGRVGVPVRRRVRHNNARAQRKSRESRESREVLRRERAQETGLIQGVPQVNKLKTFSLALGCGIQHVQGFGRDQGPGQGGGGYAR
jgi:hypothetical protein